MIVRHRIDLGAFDCIALIFNYPVINADLIGYCQGGLAAPLHFVKISSNLRNRPLQIFPPWEILATYPWPFFNINTIAA